MYYETSVLKLMLEAEFEGSRLVWNDSMLYIYVNLMHQSVIHVKFLANISDQESKLVNTKRVYFIVRSTVKK